MMIDAVTNIMKILAYFLPFYIKSSDDSHLCETYGDRYNFTLSTFHLLRSVMDDRGHNLLEKLPKGKKCHHRLL
jgi:hypothetical protein